MQPLSPYQAFNSAGKNIPKEVIDIVNNFLIEKLHVTQRENNFTRKNDIYLSARIVKDDLVERIKARVGECKTEWLDFEPLFRKEGWEVHYDRPGYNESYSGYYVFNAIVRGTEL